MTKILSQLLGAREPGFQLGIKQLEHASGGASQDIRLTTEIMRGVHDRLRQLHMDPLDTTVRELYAALMQHVHEDVQAFKQIIGDDGSDANIMPQIERFTTKLVGGKEVFALRQAAAKRLLRAHPPKKAMKQLGYRSVESMLKHEHVSALMAAAHIAETAQWHRSMAAAYKRLLPSDFETRPVQLLAPTGAKWEKISHGYVIHVKQNIMSFRELGTVVLLPLPAVGIEGASLAATLLVLHSVNDLRTASTYLKLHQVRPDFGEVVARIARHEPVTKAEIIGAYLPWKLVHRYFAHHPDAYSSDLFEPHIQQDDLDWNSAEDALAQLHPRFEFWQGAAHLGMLHQGEAVSLNFLDAVLNFCNRLPYEQRVVHYVRDHIWHELMIRYMKQGSIQETVHDQLSGELLDFNPDMM